MIDRLKVKTMWGQRKRVSGGAFFLSPTDYPQIEREN